MSLNDEERTFLVNREFIKAKTFYEQAEVNAKMEIWDVVANRLYYSAFHAVSALLIKDQHKVGTHKGAVLQFGMHYVQTGIFSKDEARFYSQLQTIREKADYNVVWETNKSDIEAMMPLAKAFIDKVKVYLDN